MKYTAQKFSHRLLGILVVIGAQLPLCGAQATTILPETHNGSTVWTDNNALDVAGIGVTVGRPGLELFYDAQFGNARIATNGGADGQVIFTARQNGLAGHDVAIVIVKPDTANSPLSVSVSGHVITVSLATDAGNAVTSTAAHVASAVNAHPAAFDLVVASAGGSGAGLVQTLSLTPLAPVIVETGPFASVYDTVFANSASFPHEAGITYGSGAAIAATSLFLYVRDAGPAPTSYIYDLLAPAFSWNGLETLMLQNFGPNVIQQLSIVGTPSRPTPVPEGSSLALLALGIGVLVWSRGRARQRA